MSIEILRPTGDGGEKNISIMHPNSTYNWDKVDDTVIDDWTTAVATMSDTWERDLYALADSGITYPANSISFIRVVGYCKAAFTPTRTNVKLCISTGGTVYEGDEQQALVGSYTFSPYGELSQIWVINPKTGLPWTTVDINALVAGISMRNNGVPTSLTVCTQLYVEIVPGILAKSLLTIGSNVRMASALDSKAKLNIQLLGGGI